MLGVRGRHLTLRQTAKSGTGKSTKEGVTQGSLNNTILRKLDRGPPVF